MSRSTLCLLALMAASITVGVASAEVDMPAVVEQLAGEGTRGRAVSTDLDAASQLLEAEIAKLGEVTVQEFVAKGGGEMRNLLLRVEGSSPDRWIVVGAHYDHLGLGEAGDANEGKVHFGADDNASGCALLLQVAAEFVTMEKGDRGVAFVWFSGEESGLLGSRHFLEQSDVPLASIEAMVNIDTVGHLESGGLTIFGVESARNFGATLDGLNSVYGFDLKRIPRTSGASDDQPFAAAGIPAMHIFTGAQATYHRPTDTVDTVDFEGLRDLADFTLELVDYLRSDDASLDFVPAGSAGAIADPNKATQGKRRVSFGSIPDFQFAGKGVLISGVLPSSPAAEAGLMKDDVIIEFAGAPVEDLTDYSEAMKRHAPGDVVSVTFLRGGERLEVEVTLVERK